MEVFSGTYEHTLDTKGRVILPASFRDDLDGGLVMTRGQDRCVEVYPQEIFQRRVDQLKEMPREDGRARAFMRVFMSGAQQDQLDGQGRVTVPPALRDYADLGRELSIIGNIDRIEIWDRSTWGRYLEQAEPGFADLDTPFDLSPTT